MTELTLQIISRTMFSSDSNGICDLVGNTLRDGTEAMTFGLLDALPVIGPWRMGRKMEHIHSIFTALDASIFKLIETRAADKAGPEKAGPIDLLGRLVAARDLESGAGLTTQEIRDEVVIIFIAGHATTAIAMTFVWYLLSKHPWAEAKTSPGACRRIGGEAAEVRGPRAPALHATSDSGGDAALSAGARPGESQARSR